MRSGKRLDKRWARFSLGMRYVMPASSTSSEDWVVRSSWRKEEQEGSHSRVDFRDWRITDILLCQYILYVHCRRCCVQVYLLEESQFCHLSFCFHKNGNNSLKSSKYISCHFSHILLFANHESNLFNLLTERKRRSRQSPWFVSAEIYCWRTTAHKRLCFLFKKVVSYSSNFDKKTRPSYSSFW